MITGNQKTAIYKFVIHMLWQCVGIKVTRIRAWGAVYKTALYRFESCLLLPITAILLNHSTIHFMRPPKVKYLKSGTKDLSNFPNFHKSGSIMGMRKLYYGNNALLVKSGNYIYNVSSEPSIYDDIK